MYYYCAHVLNNLCGSELPQAMGVGISLLTVQSLSQCQNFPQDSRASPVPLGIGVSGVVLEMVEIYSVHEGDLWRTLIFNTPAWYEIPATVPCRLKDHFPLLFSAFQGEYLLIVCDPSQFFPVCPYIVILSPMVSWWILTGFSCQVLLKLFSYCVKVKVNRQQLVKLEMNTLNVMLGTLNLVKSAGRKR